MRVSLAHGFAIVSRHNIAAAAAASRDGEDFEGSVAQIGGEAGER